MLALSIRQPFAELIPSASSGRLCAGSRRSPAWLNLAQPPDAGHRAAVFQLREQDGREEGPSTGQGGPVWSRALAMPTPREGLPDFGELSRVAWMIELAEQVGMIEPGALALLPPQTSYGGVVAAPKRTPGSGPLRSPGG